MRRHRSYIYATSLLLVLLAGCAGIIPMPAEVDVAKANVILRDNYGNPELVVIDVRSSREFDEGHLQNAVNIPVESASFRTEVRRLNPALTYIVYCLSGNRSIEARDLMKQMGFSRVAAMTGGFQAWKRAGFLIERKQW